jgi:uncharacterized protein YjbI with pentapeptide repeats
MAYTMIAERNHQKVRKQRESALILLANARVMQAEGWHVVILDDSGRDFDPRAFETSLAEKFSWYEVKPEPVPSPAIEPADEELEAEALVAAELEAEELEANDLEAEELEGVELALHDVDEAEFDDDDLEDEDFEAAELDETDREEAELDEMEFEGEPAE